MVTVTYSLQEGTAMTNLICFLAGFFFGAMVTGVAVLISEAEDDGGRYDD